MLDPLRAILRWLLTPPRQSDPITLAIPDARSTFNRGAVGLRNRPDARLRCPSCSQSFLHVSGHDMIRCPRCPFERPPDRLAEFDLLELQCPVCATSMEHGVRHPNLFDGPQWAACLECQFHWESNHTFSRARLP